MSVLKGKCQECGAIYYGWALGDPCKRICPQCNHAVDILEDDLADRAYDIAKTWRPYLVTWTTMS